MILGEIEGNLLGFYSLKLNKPVPLGDYVVNTYYKNPNGIFDSFIPDFPIMEYENRIEFIINESISELYVRIEVLKPFVQEGDCAPVPYCNECANMNNNWKRK